MFFIINVIFIINLYILNISMNINSIMSKYDIFLNIIMLGL